MAQPNTVENLEDTLSGSQKTTDQVPDHRPETIRSPGATANVAGPPAKKIRKRVKPVMPMMPRKPYPKSEVCGIAKLNGELICNRDQTLESWSEEQTV